MYLSDLMFWKKKKEEVKEAGNKSGGGQISASNIKNFVVKAVGFVSGNGNSGFSAPEHNLEEIKNAIAADSYINMAVAKYSQLIFKAGYNIISENDAAAEYLRSRLRMMSFMTGTPMDILFQQTTDDLVAYSNAFWIKARQPLPNVVGIQAKGVLDNNPVCGYFRVDPASVTIQRDAGGTIRKYHQEAGGSKKDYKPTDVIHFYLDKKGDDAFGTPRIAAALEDVKLLRKIEGNILNLIYRFAIPIYQMKIGIPQAGFMATEKEIKEAKTEIEKMASDGVLVTNERTEFKAIGAEGQALDASGYLSYFEKRVFSALNMSEAMMGRGGSKQDADSMEQQIHDTVKYIQRIFAIFIRELVFNELLLEGGYNPVLNETDICRFKFEEINLDTKVKMETHALNQFQGNCISFEEMRKQLALRSDKVDEDRLYSNMFTHPHAMEIIRARMETGSGQSPGPAGKEKSNSSTIKNIVSPENQHGTGSAKIKESFEKGDTEKNVTDYKNNFPGLFKKYREVRNEVCESGKSADILLALARESIIKTLADYMLEKADEGIKKAVKDSGKSGSAISRIPLIELVSKVSADTRKLFEDILERQNAVSSRQEKEAVFDSLEYRLRFLTEYIVPKAYWYGYVKACASLGIKRLYINFGKSGDREEHEQIVNPNSMSIESIPPFHAYCTCRILPYKENKGKG